MRATIALSKDADVVAVQITVQKRVIDLNSPKKRSLMAKKGLNPSKRRQRRHVSAGHVLLLHERKKIPKKG